MLAVMLTTFFFVADVKCGLCEINKKTTEQMLHMDRVRSKKCSETEPKRGVLDQRGPGPGPGLVLLTLLTS